MITLTSSANTHINTFLSHRGKGIGIRLGLKKSGCSGWAYVLEFADSILDTDELIEQTDFNILIDKKAVFHLDGMELDYVKEGLNEGFKFNNPNVQNECGCGESIQF